ncbi:hypothetical protein RN001_013176 [Aquatica leii]|uniref:Cytochrome P450 n=1 Tax=Aquatica leii TaxID=1421715 RepID=A0AAN7P413_9COLE|nr:hypothetical protein RN001_013176 [Aquatica leii]
MAEFTQNIYQKFSSKPYVGVYFFSKPALILRDPDLIKLVCVKEFDSFPQHNTFTSADSDPLWSNTLFAMPGGQRWRNMRAVLSPTFTSSKLRLLFTFIDQCAKDFTQHIIEQNGFVKLEMKDTFSKVTNDIIASTTLGVTCNSLKNPFNEVYIMGKDISKIDGFWKSLKFFITNLSPYLAKVLNVRFISKKTSNFFHRIVKETVTARNKLSIIRPDVIHLLMEAQKDALSQKVDETNKHSEKFEITDEVMTAQAVVFFMAGFDTSSTAMCYTAYELAINPDIQQRLIEEVDQILKQCNGNITYDQLLSMKYLDMVVSEALRKWPPFAITDRSSTRQLLIPSTQKEKPLLLGIGAIVQIPIYAIHRDEKYYTDPEKFDPERFSDENKHNIKPFTYLPFGIGPRTCIGSRFALLEIKTVIFNILTKFEIVPVDETPIPLTLSKSNVNPISDKGYWLGLKPRT